MDELCGCGGLLVCCLCRLGSSEVASANTYVRTASYKEAANCGLFDCRLGSSEVTSANTCVRTLNI